jgi:uncharacterized protein YajQ (UPF0234 family)
MKKLAITHSTIASLLENVEARNVSEAIRNAHTKINSEIKNETCAPCAKRKKSNEAISEVIAKLQGASDLELDRLKKVLGVDKLVFGVGFSFIER